MQTCNQIIIKIGLNKHLRKSITSRIVSVELLKKGGFLLG